MRTAGLWLACFFWAVSFIASKVALESASPLTVVTLRLAISALCFALWFGLRGWPRLAWTRRNAGHIVLLSLCGTTLHYGTQTVGLQYTPAANASLYASTCPVSIALIAAFTLGERLSLRKLLGIGLALAGVLCAMGLDTLRAFELGSYLKGDFLVFLSIVLWAVFTVYGKKLGARLGALELLGVVTIIGALTMLPVWALEVLRGGSGLAGMTARGWTATVFLGLTCSFLATVLYFLALEKRESQKVGVYLYTIPIMTYAAAWLYLGEAIGWNLFWGLVLVLSGVYLTERG
ncbi:MAG: DMT family transporter [Elusimicrobia bacterium]|nr:DMT family transporter [Elusimicrobiota bacterium]